MKIVCATNMPFAEEAFGTLGTVTVLEGRHITAADVRDADLLAVRSTTRVDRRLLEGSRVRFVGTATIGTDHMDLEYLRQAGIAWCYAPGCNANSVSEYVVSALLCLGRRHGFTLAGKTLGIIGVGNVGSRVAQKARGLGLGVLKNDPPRERAERQGRPIEQGAGLEPGPFVSLEELLAEADIVTLHVPLTRDGADATWHLANDAFLARMKRGSVLLNTARGPVLDSDALLRGLRESRPAHVVLDTWEHEPRYRLDVLERVDVGTPHIAGHSFEGKVNGTVMVYRAACRFLGRDPEWDVAAHMPPPVTLTITTPATGPDDEAALWAVVRQAYDIEADDRSLRANAVADVEERAAQFDRLRREYPDRREFPAHVVELRGAAQVLEPRLRALGFTVRGPYQR